MNEKRDRLDIYADILNAIKEESKKSHIFHEARLNFSRGNEYLEQLKEKNLVSSERHSPEKWYIKEDGEKFLDKYSKLRNLLSK